MSTRRQESGGIKSKSSNSNLLPAGSHTVKNPPSIPKRSKESRRAMMEKESKQREEIKEKMKSCTDRLIEVLLKGGVPNEPW